MKHINKWISAWWFALASVLLVAACGPGLDEEGNNRFSATLNGAQEVPPNASQATGTGIATVDPETRILTATVNTTGIVGLEAHIHEGAPGTNGPVVFPMTQTTAGSGVWVAGVTISEEQLETLRAGNYYFNVHSAQFPNGEIRGQILLDQGGGTTTSTGATTTTTAAGGTTTTTATGGTTTTTAAGGTTTTGAVTTTTATGGITTTTAPGGITTTTAPSGITTTTGLLTTSTAATTTTTGGVTTTTGLPLFTTTTTPTPTTTTFGLLTTTTG